MKAWIQNYGTSALTRTTLTPHFYTSQYKLTFTFLR